MKKLKKLTVVEFVVTQEDLAEPRLLAAGDVYTYFRDEESGKYYRPVDGFTVTGEDLSDRFIEIHS